jgi:hypothetical protein
MSSNACSFLTHAFKMNKTSACVITNLAIGVLAGLAAAHVFKCPAMCSGPREGSGACKGGKKNCFAGRKLTVTYFDIPALGEPIRILCVLGGLDWEDKKVSFADWGKLKPTTR